MGSEYVVMLTLRGRTAGNRHQARLSPAVGVVEALDQVA